MDHDHINQIVVLKENMEFFARKINFGGSWRERDDKISQHDVDNLHILCDFFIDNQQLIKLQFSRSKCFIYTNRLELSEQLDQLGIFEEVRVNEIILARPKNTVKSRYPGYKLRIYFKPISITEMDRWNILKFIDNNDHAIKMNIGMERFHGGGQSGGRHLTLRDYYFIDFKDERLASVLELTCPGVIRKTMDIIYDDK